MTETPLPFQQTTPQRTPQAASRLAWLVLSAATLFFLGLCVLAGYGLWRFRAYAMLPQKHNTLEVLQAPVSLIHAGEVVAISVPAGRREPLTEGETVRVGESAAPGVAALVTLWDDSTLQLYAATEVRFRTLRATGYSTRRQEVVLEVPAGQVVLGVARMEHYQQVDFTIQTSGVEIALEPDGTYILRVGQNTELAVRHGKALISPGAGEVPVVVDAGQKAVVWTGEAVAVEPARWELLYNGDFTQGLEGWIFRSTPLGECDPVDATWRLEQHTVAEVPVWAVGLERWGANRERCLAVAYLSQEVGEDLSPYQSVRLDFDLRINYHSLPVCGPAGMYCPLTVRLRYEDAGGTNREYRYNFYYRTEEGYETVPTSEGGAQHVPHYSWEHVSLELLEVEPPPVLLTGIDLLASGHDYLSWVANLSLVAE